MKWFKQTATIFMAFCLMMQTVPSCIPAGQALETEGYFNDFSSTLDGLTITNQTGSVELLKEGTDTFLRFHPGSTRATGPKIGKVMETYEGQPRMVLEFRYRISDDYSTKYDGMRPDTKFPNNESPHCYIYKDGVYSGDKTNTTEQLIAETGDTQWHTVRIIYDNEQAVRTISVDNGTPVMVNGNNYVSGTKKFAFCFTGYLAKNLYLDMDYLHVFPIPSTFSAEVENASATQPNEIAVLFNTVPETDISENDFQINGETVEKIEKDPSNEKRYLITPAQPLSLDTEYTLNISGFKNIYGLTIQESVSFCTRAKYCYAEQIEIVGKTASEITVASTFVNEKDAFYPILMAAFYNAEGGLVALKKTEQVVPNTIGETNQNKVIQTTIPLPTEQDITSLVLYYLRGALLSEPISGSVCYTKNSTVTTDAEKIVPSYTGVCDVQTLVDSAKETVQITVDTQDKKTVREVHADVISVLDNTVIYDGLLQTTDGKAEVTVAMPAMSGSFKIRIFVRGASDEEQDVVFDYYSQNVLQNEFSKINGTEATETTVSSFLNDYGKPSGLDLSKWDALSADDAKKVCTSILAHRNQLTNQQFADIPALQDAITAAIWVLEVSKSSDVTKFIKTNGTVFDISSKVIKAAEDILSELAKETLQSNMTTRAFLLLSDVKLTYTEQVILCGIGNAESYTQTRAVLEETKDILELDMSDYEKLKNPEKVMMALSGEKYSSLDALKTAFAQAVAIQKKAEVSSSDGKSGGGGSSFIPPSVNIGQTPSKTQIPTVTPTPASKWKFSDMEGFEWAKTAVYTLTEKAIIAGKTETLFSPRENITRAEFIKLVVLAFEMKSTGTANNPFIDINEQDWYTPYILTGVENKVINGISESEFSPDAPVTREMAAAILYRAFTAEEISLLIDGAGFVDSNVIADYAGTAVSKLQGQKILSGFEDGTFRPKQTLNRAEAAQMIYTSISLFE